jgi:hypothetical protein
VRPSSLPSVEVLRFLSSLSITVHHVPSGVASATRTRSGASPPTCQAAGAAAELEVMTGIPWKLSQISEKARVKHDRIGAESRRLLRRGHLYEHLGHAVPLLRHPHERSGWAG